MTERFALLVAGAGHLVLLALLSLNLARTAAPPASLAEVTTVDLVDLVAAAPAPAAAPAAIAEPAAPPAPAERPEPDSPPPAEEPAPADDRSPQEIVAEQPPPPQPRARPQPPARDGPAFDAGAIARLIESAQPAARPAPTTGAATPGARRPDARIVASLEQAIRAQIAPCWSPPVGGADVAGMTAVLRIRLNRDGSIAAPPELVSQTGATAENAAYARAFVDSARRAVLRCTPLSLPPDLYGLWRDFELNFDPRLLT